MRRTWWAGVVLGGAGLITAGACGKPLPAEDDDHSGSSSGSKGASSGSTSSPPDDVGDASIGQKENGLEAGPLPSDASCDDAACAYAPIGLPVPSSVYTDEGAVDPTAGFRALVAFPIRNEAQLQTAITAMYTVGGPSFRQYLTPATWTSTYAPDPSDVAFVTSWLTSQGMSITRTATNGLLVNFSGTVAQFNAAFHLTLHNLSRVNPETGNPPIIVYGVTSPAIAPAIIASKIASITSCDPPAGVSTLAPQTGNPSTTPPGAMAGTFTPQQITHAYNVDTLAATGSTGQGVTLAVSVGGTFGGVDVQSFWQSFGITRASPTEVQTMEPPLHRISETTVDVEWSGAMAPGAAILAYEGPDALETSLLYTFNEAIGQGKAQIVNDSFSAEQDSEAPCVRQFYDEAAMEAAALGVTVLSSSGDASRPDVPGASPFVTAVGGTALTFTDTANDFTETAWSTSGCGPTTFSVPSWQTSVVGGSTRRMSADLSTNGGPQYWWYFIGAWTQAYGTSFSSPVMAGILADVQSARATAGKPAIGYLNSILYTDVTVQKSFRDITTGGTADYAAGAGWDAPTGWGAPQADQLATALP